MFPKGVQEDVIPQFILLHIRTSINESERWKWHKMPSHVPPTLI